jgi:hypothetical protein
MGEQLGLMMRNAWRNTHSTDPAIVRRGPLYRVRADSKTERLLGYLGVGLCSLMSAHPRVCFLDVGLEERRCYSGANVSAILSDGHELTPLYVCSECIGSVDTRGEHYCPLDVRALLTCLDVERVFYLEKCFVYPERGSLSTTTSSIQQTRFLY